MIYMHKKAVEYAGSCNFCNRGGTKGRFPYKFVYEVSGTGDTTVRICKKCLDGIKKIKPINKNNE